MTSVGLPVGTIVKHTKFGEGRIKNVNADGTVYNVFFFSVNTSVLGVHYSSLVRVENLEVIKSVTQVPALNTIKPSFISQAVFPRSSLPTGRDNAEEIGQGPIDSKSTPQDYEPTAESGIERGHSFARLTLECLRQGLPPPGKLTEWTVGNLAARNTIRDAIKGAIGGRGKVLYACANYGQGKSHFGRLGREMAREQGLISFHAELDGNGVSLAQGTRLVATLFASAQLPEEVQDQEHLIPGLSTILKRAAPQAKRHVPLELNDFLPFLEKTELWTESEEVIQVLEEYLSGYLSKGLSESKLQELTGKKIHLNTLRMDSGRMADRCERQARQLGRIVQLAMMAGAKGAFIVLDELDHDYQNLTARKNLLLAELCELTSKFPIILLLLTRELPVDNADEIVLNEISYEDQKSLVNKAIDAFTDAHPSTCFKEGREVLFEKILGLYNREYLNLGWGPRFFVRATVECCEFALSANFGSLAMVDI